MILTVKKVKKWLKENGYQVSRYYEYRDKLKILPVSYHENNKNAPFHLASHLEVFEREFARLHAPKPRIPRPKFPGLSLQEASLARRRIFHLGR